MILKRVFTAVFLMILYNTLYGQTSGSFWIKTFKPGSSDINDETIDKASLAKLDSLMQNPEVEIKFLGAADSLTWKMNGKRVYPDISEAWNDAKRLGRARELRARYKRGSVGITHENIAGVKVIWKQKSEENIAEEIQDINSELTKLKDDFTDLQSKSDEKIVQQSSKTNWGLEAGVWTWQGGSNGSLFLPSLALKIGIRSTAFVLQGGVTPWHFSSENGNQAESFVYAGLRYMKSKRLGFSLGGFRGWEFFTTIDRWSFKTTGLAGGIILKYGILEVTPALNYSNINTLTGASNWRFGTNIGFALIINEMFK